MNKIITFSLLLLSIACTTPTQQSNSTAIAVNNDAKVVTEKGFDLTLQLEEAENGDYYLSAALELDKGSYVISPFSEDTTYGHFGIDIADNHHVIADEPVLEIPASVDEFDDFLERRVKFVRVNTTYKQKVKVVTEDDFDIPGMIFLLVEPQCVPYEVEFTLSNRSGKMSVAKTSTSTTKAYQKWLGSRN